jgi:hypothetical protein
MCTEKWYSAPQPSISSPLLSSPLALVHPRAPAIACEDAQQDLTGRKPSLSVRLAHHAFIDCTFH